jgi:DNA uptake protein ComE-like DNA-binding protein
MTPTPPQSEARTCDGVIIRAARPHFPPPVLRGGVREGVRSIGARQMAPSPTLPRSTGGGSGRRRSRRPQRRGAIFVTALGIILILSALVLVFCQDMRTEAIASGNRLAYVQADAIEQGAEKWVLAQTETYAPDAITVTQVPAEALQVGNGYFWLLAPNPNTDQQYWFAIQDEAGKLNINSATSNQLINLPGMDQETADSIVNWHRATASANGADSPDYNSLPEPYDAKHSAYETVEELNLIENVDNILLYGLDQNRDGVVSDAERNNPPVSTNPNGNSSAMAGATVNTVDGFNRGIFNDLTCYSVEPNTATGGGSRINVNATNTQPLLQYLTKQIGSARAGAIMGRVQSLVRRSRGRQVFPNLGVFYMMSGMTPQEFSQVADKLTTSSAKTLTGMVNVNTASLETLMCLPGIQQSDAQALVAYRAGNANPGIGWIFQAVNPQTAAALTQYITARSFIYSADIVAVSGDGRSFKRVRIVVDAQKTPAKIIYRRDLTSLGWPLPEEIRTALRSGKQPPVYGLTGAPSTLGQ